jgi:hypothetical protein
MKAYWGWRYSSTHSLISAIDEGEWSASRPGHFTPRERAPGTPWIGDWVGRQSLSGRGGEEKNSQPLAVLEPPITHPVVQCYTIELSRLLGLQCLL